MPFYARPTAQRFHCRMLPVIPYCSGRAKWCLLLVGFSCDVYWVRGEPKICPNFRIWEMPVYIHIAISRCIRSGQRVLKARHLAQGCVFGESERWSPTFKKRLKVTAYDSEIYTATFFANKNLAIANRSHVSCAHNTSRAFIGLNIPAWPWNLGKGSLKVTQTEPLDRSYTTYY